MRTSNKVFKAEQKKKVLQSVNYDAPIYLPAGMYVSAETRTTRSGCLMRKNWATRQQPTRMLISAGALRNMKKLIFHLSLFPTCLAFLFYLSIVCPSPYSCVTRRRKIV